MRLRILKEPFLVTGACFFLFLFTFAFLVGIFPARLVTLLAVVGVGALVVESLNRGLLPSFIKKLGPMIPWMLFVLLSYAVLPLLPYAGSRAWNNLTGMIFAFSVFMLSRNFGKVPVVNQFYLFYTAIVVVFFVMFPGILGVNLGQERLSLSAAALDDSGGWNNPNDVARLLGISALIILGGITHFPAKLFLPNGGSRNLLLLFKYASVVVALFVIIVYSGSRSALIWVLAVFGYTVAGRFSKNIFLAAIISTITSLMLVLLLFFMFPELQIFSRITVLFDSVAMRGKGEASFYTRSEMITDALKMWSESPIWGNGNEAFRVNAGYGTYSHSNYAELLANYGLLGLVLFYVPTFVGVIHCWNMRLSQNPEMRRQAIWLLICCVVMFVISLPNIVYYTKYVLLFYGIVLGRIYYLKDNYHRFNHSVNRPVFRHGRL